MAEPPDVSDRISDGAELSEKQSDDNLGSNSGAQSGHGNSSNDTPAPGRDEAAGETQFQETADEPGYERGDPSKQEEHLGSSEELKEVCQYGGQGHCSVVADANAETRPSSSEVLEGSESTREENSYSNSKVSSGGNDGFSSGDTSELSGDERLASEMRRAEIRRGKEREVSPTPSLRSTSEEPSGGMPTIAIPDSQLHEYKREVLSSPSLDEGRVGGVSSASDTTEMDLLEETTFVHIPWEKDPERELQKLPIRLRDLNGRTFLLPWNSVKTWKGAKGLIRKIHSYHEHLLDIIDEGEYHLLAKNVWANEEDATIGDSLSGYPRTPASSSGAQSTASAPAGNSMPQMGHTGNPMNSGRNRIPRTRDAIILPELWESVVEPGMYIDMVVWHFSGRHPIFGQVPPQHGGRGRGSVVPGGVGRGYPSTAPPLPPDFLSNAQSQALSHMQAQTYAAHQPVQVGGPNNIQVGIARGNSLPPRLAGQPRVMSVAPRRIVKTRVKQAP